VYETTCQLMYRKTQLAYPQEKVMADTEEIARSIASFGLMPISAILSLSFNLRYQLVCRIRIIAGLT
jgi:hypothetical protein